MKTRIPNPPASIPGIVRMATLAAALGTALGASAASASSIISTGNLAVDVQSAVGGDGAVRVSLDDGVATLTGNVQNTSVADAATRAALRHDDVDEVVDMLSVS